MANKIGSEFIEDFEVNTRNFEATLRQVALFLGVILGIVVTGGAIWFDMPDLFYWTFDGVVVLPMVFYGGYLDKKFKLKERLYFLTLETIRIYETELDEER